MLVTLSSPSGKHNLASIMDLPVFHPCVRLNKWKERPGELSFIPPDGRFILAGYEVDLLPFTSGTVDSLTSNNLKLPVSVEVKTGLGGNGAEFEVRLQVNKVFGAPSGGSSSGGLGRGGSGRLGSPSPGTPQAPVLEDLVVTIPLPADVRNLSDIRPSRGDASFNPGDKVLEWHIATKDISGSSSHFGLRCSVVGPFGSGDEDNEDDAAAGGFGFGNDYGYSDTYQSSSPTQEKTKKAKKTKKKAKKSANGDDDEGGADARGQSSAADDPEAKAAAQNKMLMPTSATVSFSVKGWLASGLKVESIVIDTRKSRGLGEGVKPYKGVKYLTVSKGGVEVRC